MLWVGGQDVLSGNITPGELAAFIFYAFIVAGSVGAISEVYSDLQRAAGATERLLELLGADSQLPEPATPRKPQEPLYVQARNLSFSYPTRPTEPVLADLSFSAAPGEMLAIVGPSGAGKSTLLDLLQRFYDPTAGQIEIGGVPLPEMRLTELRDLVGFVPQDPVLFAGSLKDNLRYGCPEADEAAMARSLRLAHAAEFIAELPEGLETRVGEGGVGLSGGQRQRLAIARALLVDPKILLLDEATSALDAQSEEHIRESLKDMQGERTIVVIAHRLSTVRQADRILVLEDGRLAASGTHEELLSASELYARFVRIQFASSVHELEDAAANGDVPNSIGEHLEDEPSQVSTGPAHRYTG
jgi:ATP-binding cassette subfamily B protein